MKKIVQLNPEEARNHFLKGSSFFNNDFPKYINFEPILASVAEIIHDDFAGHILSRPELSQKVNYSFTTNKDGRFAWRPFELMHPAIYVSLVNLICADSHWQHITSRFAELSKGVVECCSIPIVSTDDEKDQAAQVKSWWQTVEQRSLELSLEFNHILHTDVTNCYGSLYTHSIPWSLHGLRTAKKEKGNNDLLGNKIDAYIRAGRCGQTNGISQGSVLMDFIAELVLSYIDKRVSIALGHAEDFKILRYRDDYRIFANSDVRAEEILKIIGDQLRTVGMQLGTAKTIIGSNVVEGSIKPDKLAGIELQNLGKSNAKSLQKQLIRLHSFGKRFPNSGALRRLLSDFHSKVIKLKKNPTDLEVQVAIAVDISVVSPMTFPVVAGILSHLLSLATKEEKIKLWGKIQNKVSMVPYNGYLEVWLQRVTKPKAVGLKYESKERICRIVNGENIDLWNNRWLSNKRLIEAVDATKIVVEDASEAPEAMTLDEVRLFRDNAYHY